MSAHDSAAPGGKRFAQCAVALITLASGLCACLLWTVPNWQVFWTIVVPQLAPLWRVPANRPLIVALALKVAAPLPIMALTAMSLWLVSLLWSLLAPDASAAVMVDSKQPEWAVPSPALPIQAFPRQPEEPARLLHNPAAPTGPSENAQQKAGGKAQEAAEEQGEGQVQDAEIARERLANVGVAASGEVGEIAVPDTTTQTVQAPPEPHLALTLLGKVALSFIVPGVTMRVIPVNQKGLHLLAFLAVRRGEAVARDKILYHLFEWGTSLEEETSEVDHLRSLSMAFEQQKKMLRRVTRRVIARVNAEEERLWLDPQIDPLQTDGNERWSLAPCCRVPDIEEVETQNAVIEQARKEGLLIPGTIPMRVKAACDRLLAAYKGDFLADLIKDIPQDFLPWEGKASWARRYSTYYRDLYLKALWIAGEYEQQEAQRSVSLTAAPGTLGTEQREHYARAITCFRRYAEDACETRFDEKVSFDPASRLYGERITESERALRRCLALCAVVGDTHEAGVIYATYARQMTSLLRGWRQTWQPSAETQRELERVGGQTGAHRFAAHLSTRMQKGVPTDSASHQ